MMEIKNTKLLDGTIVNGVEGEYIFDTINTSKDYYEKKLLDQYLPYVKDAKVILDIGANIGNHSLYWTKNCSDVKIYSFEANTEVFEILKRNKEDNGYSNLSVFNYAIGSSTGYAKIKSMDESNLGATEFETCEDDELQIKMIDIDSWVKEQEIKQIDFVKIDVEGFEGNVVAGMRETIHEFKPMVWIELWPQNAGDVLELLTKEGYSCVKMDAMNLFFVAKEKLNGLTEIGEKDLILAMLHYVERTNLYYKNYNTAKKWHQAALEKVEFLKGRYEEKKNEIEQVKKDKAAEIERVESEKVAEIERVESEKAAEIERLESEKVAEIERVESEKAAELEKIRKKIEEERRRSLEEKIQLEKNHLSEIAVYEACVLKLNEELEKSVQLLKKLETVEMMTKEERCELEFQARMYRKIRYSFLGKFIGNVYHWLKKVRGNR